VQLAGVEVLDDLPLLLVHQPVGEDEVSLVAVGPRHGLEARE
jgi:hypothetical protein